MDRITRLLKDELIGRNLRLVREGHAVEGRIIDETKNTVLVLSSNRKIRLIKALNTFEFKEGSHLVRVDGTLLSRRPEERIKAKLMKEW